MRVIGGKLRGHNFNSTPGHRTHPMSEKIRGAIFNALGDIDGLSVLDAYAGTGALSVEAASRGASVVQAIDADQSAARTIKENVEKLDLSDKVSVTRAFVLAWSRRNPNAKFDVVLLDPPYDKVEPKELINLSKHCDAGGILVLSLPPTSGFRFGSSNQELLATKLYGDAELTIYRQL